MSHAARQQRKIDEANAHQRSRVRLHAVSGEDEENNKGDASLRNNDIVVIESRVIGRRLEV